MLGSGSGSYALSKTKTDLFLRSLESYINTVVDILNKQLIERLWQLNGLDWSTMPKLVAGDVAAHDLAAVSSLIRNMNNADVPLFEHPETIADIMNIAEIDFDKELYESRLQQRKDQQAQQEAQPPEGELNA